MNKYLVCFGTRPEYIKVLSLIENMPNLKTCYIQQHESINLKYPVDMVIPINNKLSRLNDIISSILENENKFKDLDYIIVQGDTTSALAVALTGFNLGKKIIHLEAGLRTFDRTDPFPEEINRQLITRMAYLHLSPTKLNKQNLINEGIDPNIIHVVGNTGLDQIKKTNIYYGNSVLITLHRRNNLSNIKEWFQYLENISSNYSELDFIFPMHGNPLIQKHKSIFEKINVIKALNNSDLIELIKRVKFIITDSGGIQEEASYLRKKVIVCRKSTERPEIIGKISILCKEVKDLERCIQMVNSDYKVPNNYISPYGDGNSWKKIKIILDSL